ncbi:MAG: hypothetical protein J3K34DRAFT_444419 [Monoraphidium minutum]|nr:MAG: hypothetical protein J3K34DRAFT_444419 [Monoraphidium minutum]
MPPGPPFLTMKRRRLEAQQAARPKHPCTAGTANAPPPPPGAAAEHNTAPTKAQQVHTSPQAAAFLASVSRRSTPSATRRQCEGSPVPSLQSLWGVVHAAAPLERAACIPSGGRLRWMDGIAKQQRRTAAKQSRQAGPWARKQVAAGAGGRVLQGRGSRHSAARGRGAGRGGQTGGRARAQAICKAA